MQRGNDLICPFCNCILRSGNKARKHIGTGFSTSVCPQKVEWLNRVPCPGGAPTCRVPVQLLTADYHRPQQCLLDYQDWEALKDHLPTIGVFRSIWHSGSLPRVSTVRRAPVVVPESESSSIINSDSSNDGDWADWE